ncbi:MAG: methylation-associated defense system protein kinase MAD6 [Pseudanabaena sp.]|jgi:serine/threonine protein kinase
MAKHIAIGKIANEFENNAIKFLKSKLPDTFTIFSNFELKQGKDIYEVDLAIIAPQCVFVVDIKNIVGHIDIYDKWCPENREPFTSPLAKLRQHAKVISSLISNSNKAQSHTLKKIHIQAAILITSLETTITDHNGKDEDSITYLRESIEFFKSAHLIPDHRLQDIYNYSSAIEKAIRGKTQPKSTPTFYRDWQLEQKFSSSDHLEEYRARHSLIPTRTARLKIYLAEPYPDPDNPDPDKKRILTTFAALSQIDHPNIQKTKDFFETEDKDRFILVLDEIEGRPLSQAIHLLSTVQKYDILNQVLGAMEYVHEHGIIHRNLSPDCILITHNKGQAIITGFEYARNRDRTHTIAEEIIDSIDYKYQPLECQQDPSKASIASDLFSIGAIFYYIFTGKKLFEQAQDLQSRPISFIEPPSQLNPELTTSFDNWIQKICAKNPQDRFISADAARQSLTPIATSETIDLTNLPLDYLINNQYLVKEKLGKVGSFCVTYKVWETTAEIYEVLKLVVRDRISQYDRAKQEYKILRQLPEHNHIVKVRNAAQLPDETPFIVFDYVEGRDLTSFRTGFDLSFEQSISIAEQTATGLAHLHKHGIYHQDIKPSNLFITTSEKEICVKIIDFNIAASERDESPTSAGTQRYLPPDFNFQDSTSLEAKIDRDLYALGITFYECLTGHYPFDGGFPAPNLLPLNPDTLGLTIPVPDKLTALLNKAIAPQRSDRFKSTTDFLQSLEKCFEKSLPDHPLPKPLEVNVKPITPPSPIIPIIDAKTFFSSHQNSIALPHKTPDNFTVTLDPTDTYQVPEGYQAINSELEWLKYFHVEELTEAKHYWISGSYLCNFTRKWLELHGLLDKIITEKQDPINFLETLINDANILAKFQTEPLANYLYALCDRLNHYQITKPQADPIVDLLADITGNHQIWTEIPSIEHLAQWLIVNLHDDFIPLEKYWQQVIVKSVSNPQLALAYAVDNKQDLLRSWIGLNSTDKVIQDFGEFPLNIPSALLKELNNYWQQKILESEGKVLDTLSPDLPNIQQVINLAYDLSIKHPELIVSDRIHRLPYSVSQRNKLLSLLPQDLPQELNLKSSVTEAINWATQQYLPFRQWELTVAKKSIRERESDRLGESFAHWLYQQYPKLKTLSVADSPLNYSTAHLVTQLAKHTPVLWVVVDGLGWLDHQELLQYLTEGNSSKHTLKIEVELSPRISILPTKTEYAKWSLYTQLPCDRSDWSPEIAQAFPQMGIGDRYTDGRCNILYADLRNTKHSLFCWDTEQLDHLYHDSRDWDSLYQSDRPATLRKLADQIHYCIQQHPQTQSLKVVIASDHGQLMGEVPLLPNPPHDVNGSGRIAIGRTEDPRCFVLGAKAFGLPEDISVPKNGSCFSTFQRTSQGMGIGLHGGLFPEEAIIGVSVLSQIVERKPVSISINGSSKASQKGKLSITIDNRRNSVAIYDLILSIKELPEFIYGKQITRQLSNRKETYTIEITFPKLSPNTKGTNDVKYTLSGDLRFRFADGETMHIDLPADTAIMLSQIYASGIAGGLDEFL